jgi:TonB-linked SusC/RagA family outer membrane protein
MNKIIHVNECIPISRGGKKIVSKMMKLVLIILVVSLQVSAAEDGYSQRVTLSVKNAPLKSVLQSIRKQSGYSFLYKDDQFINAKPVTISVKERPIEEILQVIFKDQPIGYTIQDKIIIVQSRGEESSAGTEFVELTNIKGTVVDKDGQPLVGATVIVVGMNNKGATTNERGEFKLNGVPVNGKVLVRMIGYETKEFSYSEGVVLNVRLKEVKSELDEVHVIAYGTTSKRLSTSPIAGISAKDIATQPVTNPLLAMQGRIPGVFIKQVTGLPGSGVNVQIQGVNSIGKGNDPFYVVDGVPYTSQLLPAYNPILGVGGNNGNVLGPGNPLSFINPADIESIEVLKDADATAIYGSRAANGAILITTKKGAAGQTRVNVTMQQGVGQVGRKMHMLNTDQYLQMRKEAYTNSNETIPTPSGIKNSSNYDLTVWDQSRYTDWQKELIGGSANYTDVQAAISGGQGLTTFRLNTGYHRETTVFPGNFSDMKGSVGFNFNHATLDQKFQMQFSSTYQIDNNQLPTRDLTLDALQLAPNAPALYNSNGALNWQRIQLQLGADSVKTWTNPLSYFKNTSQIKTNNLISNLTLSYMLIKGLNVKASFGYTDLISKEINTYPLTAFSPEEVPRKTRSGNYSNGRINSWIIEPLLSYDFNINKGHVSVLVGSTFQQNNNDLDQITGSGFSTDEVIRDYRQATTLTPGLNRVLSTYKYNALFTRLNYNWANKYILNLTARRDGSSRFGAENQFHNFGAVGTAWLFTNEEFMKDLPGLSFGKIRGSFGTTGNDQIGDYGYLNQYEVIFARRNYQDVRGLQVNKLPNPYLQWELTKKLQLGLDIGFVQDRIFLGVTYYSNCSSNQLMSYNLPFQTGFGGIFGNFPATVQNSGWEVMLTTNNLKKARFSWTTNFNISANRNKLVAFPNIEQSSSANFLVIGEPIALTKLFNFIDVNPDNGLAQFKNADGKIVEVPDFDKDRYIYSTTLPKYFGGLQNTVIYKNFTLDFLFQFVKTEAQYYNYGNSFLSGTNLNMPNDVLSRWRKPGDQTDIQKFSMNDYLDYLQTSNFTVKDASYIKLRNLSFSYTLPSSWTKRFNIQSCRLFAQGQNLLSITHYSGFDPETASYSSLPPLRIYTFGLQLSL